MSFKDILRPLLLTKPELGMCLLLILAADTVAVPATACASILAMAAIESSKLAPSNLPGEAILGILCLPQIMVISSTAVLAYWGSRELSKMSILTPKDTD